MSTLVGHDVKFVQAGSGYKHSWSNVPKGRWYAVGDTSTSGLNGTFSTPYDQAEGPYQEIGAIEYKEVTDVNEAYESHPRNVFLRVNPVYGPNGAINQSGWFFITYHSTIKFKKTTRGLLTINKPLVTATATDSYARATLPVMNLSNPRMLSSWQDKYIYQQPNQTAPQARKKPYSKPQ